MALFCNLLEPKDLQIVLLSATTACATQHTHGQGTRNRMEDELDAALDVELEASFLQNSSRPSQIDYPQVTCSGPSSSSSTAIPTGARLTFSFPDWAIDICNDVKRRRVSILRHSAPGDVHVEGAKAQASPVIRSLKKKAWKLEADSRVWKLEDSEEGTSDFGVAGDEHFEDCGDRKAEVGERLTSCNELPDDVLANICKRLSVRDLCSAIQTCQRWYFTGLLDELWEASEVRTAHFINSSSKGCRRWTTVKNTILSDRVSQKFHGYRKGYEFLRYAMNSWWDLGKPDGRYPAAVFRTVMQKLTVNNWSLLYEGFGVIFIDRTDWIASLLLKESGSQENFGSRKTSLQSGASKGSSNETKNVKRECNISSGQDGKLLWQAVETYWRCYKRWLTLVVRNCHELNHEVMAERARSHSLVSTPTLYDGGVICFRSQIVLRYGLRHALQAGYTSLNALDATGSASEHETELLKSVHHLLQELDVHDDFTLPPAGYTQEKLRRCFCSQHAMSRKLQKRELSVLVTPSH